MERAAERGADRANGHWHGLGEARIQEVRRLAAIGDNVYLRDVEACPQPTLPRFAAATMAPGTIRERD